MSAAAGRGHGFGTEAPSGRSAALTERAPAMRNDGVVRAKVYLHAGQLHASVEPCEITTILGSCVAVCLVDPIAHAAGVNHYLLPLRVGTAHASARFGNVAIAELLERLLGLGCRHRDLRAKIFGGSTLTGGVRIASQALGEQNIRLAREMLSQQDIPIIAEDVGGNRGRKLVVRTDEGAVFVKKL